MFKPILIPKEIRGNGIIAKAVCTEMSTELFGAIDTSRERLREFLYWVDFVKTETDELQAIKDFIKERKKGNIFAYALFDDVEKLVGTLDVHAISYTNNAAEIGYWLKNGETGKGCISKILPLIEQTFFEAGIHRLVIECVVENIASAAVAERNGYTFEGIAYDKGYGHDRYWDNKVYAKINPA